MKRFHVHAYVQELEQSIAFYSKLFDAPPTRVEGDYAKWMLEDPRINFAISTRGGKPGVDHLGLQADSEEELAELKERARQHSDVQRDQGGGTELACVLCDECTPGQARHGPGQVGVLLLLRLRRT